ncbi:hypothetical protein HUJ05_007713 [Dendroctonus ponderosae]|nr:hypothetical protein HUJ05_007713 [Dendroctonus ponderosae]
MIAQFGDENHRKWDTNLSKHVFAINSSRHDSTGFSPAFLNFGRAGPSSGPCTEITTLTFPKMARCISTKPPGGICTLDPANSVRLRLGFPVFEDNIRTSYLTLDNIRTRLMVGPSHKTVTAVRTSTEPMRQRRAIYPAVAVCRHKPFFLKPSHETETVLRTSQQLQPFADLKVVFGTVS